MVYIPQRVHSLKGKDPATKFFRLVIQKYLSDKDLFKKHFLKLNDYDYFQSIVSKSLEELSESQSKKIRNLDKDLINYIINAMCMHQIRIGVVLQEEVKKYLSYNQHHYYAAPCISWEGEIERIIPESEIETKFTYQNRAKIIVGSIKQYSQIKNLHEMKNSIKIPVIETEKSRKEICIDFMERVLLPSLREFISDDNITKVYQYLLNVYKKWLLKANNSEVIKTLTEDIAKLQHYVKNLNNYLSKGKNQKSAFFKTIKKISEEIQLTISSCYNKTEKKPKNRCQRGKITAVLKSIINTAYKGKSFPSFPGILIPNSLSVLPPVSLSKSRYEVPTFGSGWNIEKNNLFLFLVLYVIMKRLEENDAYPTFTEEEIDYLENIKDQLERIFYTLDINPNYIILPHYVSLIQSLSNRKEIERFHKIIFRHLEDYDSAKLLYISEPKRGTNKKRLQIISKNRYIKRLRVLLLYNKKDENETNMAWNYNEETILPEVITMLLSNAGLWPKNIQLYCSMYDFALTKDQNWSRANGFYRILKGTIDGIILYLMVSGEVQIYFKENQSNMDYAKTSPETNVLKCLGDQEGLLLIPILNSDKKNTNIHEYYYSLLEVLYSLQELEIERAPFKYSTEYLKDLMKQWSNQIDVKLNQAYTKIRNISQRIFIQHFNVIPKIRDFQNKYSVWKSWNMEIREKIYNNFKKFIGVDLEAVKTYKFKNQQSFEKILRLIPYKPANGNYRVFAELFLGMSLTRIGCKIASNQRKSSAKPIQHIIRSIMNHNEDINVLDNYFQRNKKSLKPKIQNLYNDALVNSLINASSSLARTIGGCISYHACMSKEKRDEEVRLNKYTNYVTVLIESKILRRFQNSSENLFQIQAILHQKHKPVSILFNEFFIDSPQKHIDDYKTKIISSLLAILYNKEIPIILRIKNTPKTGKAISSIAQNIQRETNPTNRYDEWRYFIDIARNLNHIEKYARSINEEKTKIFLGFFEDFLKIPVFYYKNDRYRLLSFKTKAVFGDELDGTTESYPFIIKLLVRGSNKKEMTDLYLHGNAIVGILKQDSNSSREYETDITNILLLGAISGDEGGKVSMIGMKRLFAFPHTDIRNRVISTSLFIKGVDHYVLKPEEDY